MKKLFTFLLVLLSCAVMAQDNQFEKGKKLFLQLKYAEAIPFLEKSFKENSNAEALHFLAYSYLYSKDYSSATLYFRQLAFDRKADPEYYLEYAKLLKNQGFYIEARPWLIQYLRSNPGSMEVRQLLRSIDLTPELMNNPLGFGVSPWKYNTADMEFSPVAYQAGYVFVSNRVKDVDGGNYGWDNMPFLKLMYATDSTSPEIFSYRLSGNYHFGPAAFSANFQRIYFTRNYMEKGRVVTDQKGTTRLMILYSDKINGKWLRPHSVSFSSKDYSVGHPSLNADGTIMYFSSDMPGGEGGSDIWMVRQVGPTEWSAPENMGPKINSPGDELFPSLFADTLLNFSSDYHPGLGGLDIFYSTWNGNAWSAPVNMGYPVNSFMDDFGMAYSNEGNTGMLASNRVGGKGSDDIYTFKKIKVCVRITVMDSVSYSLLPKAVVRITNGFHYTEELVTGADGKVSLCLPIDNNFKITTERKGYLPKRYSFSSKGLVSDKDTQLLAELVEGVLLNFSGLVRDDETNELLEGALVKITGPSNFQEITSSNSSGYFDLAIDSRVPYEISVTKDGYLLHKEKFTMPDSTSIKVVRLRPSVINQKIKIRNIYYDLNSALIRPDAQGVLDTLVKIMKDNPYLQIEMGSHTDSRASGDYNQKLSIERAKAVIAYLQQRGIDPYRIEYHYYGETQLLVPCPDGVECGEELHQMNRRTEFKILAY